MGKKGYISETMGSGRIVSHGKVEFSPNLTIPGTQIKVFSLAPANIPFSIYIRPKNSDVDAADVLVYVKCYQDNGFTETPIPLNDWTPLSIMAISCYNFDYQDYDIYWGAGTYVDVAEISYIKNFIDAMFDMITPSVNGRSSGEVEELQLSLVELCLLGISVSQLRELWNKRFPKIPFTATIELPWE